MSHDLKQGEPTLEPDLPIIDPHHHLWRMADQPGTGPPRHDFEYVFRRVPVYLLDELMTDLGSGHDVRATVFMECGSMYRADGPEILRAVGETEFVNGLAAQSASGLYGRSRACAGIVGHAELQRGAAVVELLEAHIAAGGGRFRGIRQGAAYDPDPTVIAPILQNEPGFYRSARFRQGFAHVAPLGLSFDAFLLEPQLEDLVDLARAFPSTSIILDHVGAPLGIASYVGRREERFPIWRRHIQALASLDNVCVKLGGLGMVLAGFKSCRSQSPCSSVQLAADWKPYLETCIEAFGVNRCMFQSNYPAEVLSGTYHTIWNAFKVVAAGYSQAEKRALFSETARRIYRLDDIQL